MKIFFTRILIAIHLLTLFIPLFLSKNSAYAIEYSHTSLVSGGDVRQDLQGSEILVELHEDIDTQQGQQAIEQIQDSHGLEVTSRVPDTQIVVMSMSDVTIDTIDPIDSVVNVQHTDQMIASLKKDPRVKRVQKNFYYSLESIGTSDTSTGELWGLHNIGQTVNGITGSVDADIDFPEAIVYASGKLSYTTVVGVMDSGIAYDHPDLHSNMWDGSGCLSETGATMGGCIHGYDFLDNDLDPNDTDMATYSHGHGTHVAGIIGAVTDNSLGGLGVAPNVKLMGLRVCGYDGCSTADQIRGLRFARANGVRVINMSFGGQKTIQAPEDFDDLLYEAIRDFPGIIIAAAGNDGVDTSAIKFFPAGFASDTLVPDGSGTILKTGLNNMIVVGASDQNDIRALFSNYGIGVVHIAAPGVNIYNTYPYHSMQSDSLVGSGWIRTGGVVDAWTGATQSGTQIYGDITPVKYGIYSASGQSTYVQKSFSGHQNSIAGIGGIRVWCDTPIGSGDWGDYLTIEVDTGTGMRLIHQLDEAALWSYPINYDEQRFGQTGATALVHVPWFTGDHDFTLRFGWHTDGIDDLDPDTWHPYHGCSIDSTFDIGFTDSGVGGEYKHLQGTSMATPFVAGSVAVGWSMASGATIDDIKRAVLSGSDSIPALTPYIQGGRRLNLSGMVQMLDTPHLLSHGVSSYSGSSIILGATTDIPTLATIQYQAVSSSGQVLFTGSTSLYATGHTLTLTGIITDTLYQYRIGLIGQKSLYTNPDSLTWYNFSITGSTNTGSMSTGTTPIATPVTVSGGGGGGGGGSYSVSVSQSTAPVVQASTGTSVISIPLIATGSIDHTRENSVVLSGSNISSRTIATYLSLLATQKKQTQSQFLSTPIIDQLSGLNSVQKKGAIQSIIRKLRTTPLIHSNQYLSTTKVRLIRELQVVLRQIQKPIKSH